MATISDMQFDSVIIGLGRAGCELHIPILQKMSKDPEPRFRRIAGLVDRDQRKIQRAIHKLEDDYEYDVSAVVRAESIENLAQLNPDSCIVHICTPAISHLSSLHEAACAGFKNIIVEKPCASTAADVDSMCRLAAEYNLNVAVVNPYLYSRSIEKCLEAVTSRDGYISYLEFELSKPRKRPTLDKRSVPDSVFDVELPHQIAAALYITQAQAYSVLRADVRDMHYKETSEPCTVVNNMGLGVVVLALDRCIAVLVSYLDAPTRTRVLKLRFEDQHQVQVFFPVTEDDYTAVIEEYAAPHSDGSIYQTAKEKYPDDLLKRCISSIYSGFSSATKFADLAFNRKVVDVMDQAKSRARVRREMKAL